MRFCKSIFNLALYYSCTYVMVWTLLLYICYGMDIIAVYMLRYGHYCCIYVMVWTLLLYICDGMDIIAVYM